MIPHIDVFTLLYLAAALWSIVLLLDKPPIEFSGKKDGPINRWGRMSTFTDSGHSDHAKIKKTKGKNGQ